MLISQYSSAAKQTCQKVKQSKPTSYYTKNFKPVGIPELKSFLSLRFRMEKGVIKLRYESYLQGAGHNFVLCNLSFRETMEGDHFVALWGCLHLVVQTEEAVDKSDKIYKVRDMPLFCQYYNPCQQLSLDEGMIPQEPLVVHMRQTFRWASRAFCCARPKQVTSSIQKSTPAG